MARFQDVRKNEYNDIHICKYMATEKKRSSGGKSSEEKKQALLQSLKKSSDEKKDPKVVAYDRWRQFLNRCKSHDNGKTHVSQVKPKMCLNISTTIEEQFYREYALARAAGIRVGIAECPKNSMPLLIDFDWRFETKDHTRVYTLKHIQRLVKCIRAAVRKLYEDVTDKTLMCLVLEKGRQMRPVEGKEGVVKDGWHLHFPYCHINKLQQKTDLRKEVLRNLHETKALSELTDQSLNTLEDAYDAEIPNVYWLMYGSCKETDTTTWQVTHCLNSHGKKCFLENVFEDFSVDKLPQLMSVNRDDVPTLQLKEEFVKKILPVDIRPKLPELTREQIKTVKADLVHVRMFLECIKDETWENYHDWIELGFCLYTVSQGNEKGLQLWKDFSSRSEKYDEEVCERAWEKMYVGNATIGTIKWYARRDNEKKYLKVLSETHGGIYNCIKSQDSYDIGKFIFNRYSERFKCVDMKSNLWYEFRQSDHRWSKSDSAVGLETLLPTEIAAIFEHEIKELNESANFDGDDKVKALTKKIKQKQEHLEKCSPSDEDYDTTKAALDRLKKEKESLRSNNEERDAQKKVLVGVIKQLKNYNKRLQIMRELRVLFYDSEFFQKLDTNVNLFCFKNGIYDLDKMHFRDGRPSDYISLCCGHNYEPQITEDDPRVIKLRQHFKMTFPNENNRLFFMRWTARCLKGGNFDKLFVVWIGMGDNAKSITSELLELGFGVGPTGYMFKFPTGTLIGGHAKGSGTMSDLARMHGKRIGGFQEPPQGAHINVGLLKELTGGDTMYTRDVFEKGRETRPDMKLFLQCNHAPKAPSYDKAYYNRLRLINFEATFTYDAPKDEDEQFRQKRFPRDDSFKSYLPWLAPALLWILIEEYKSCKNKSLVAPQEVMAATLNYRRNNDAIMQFVDMNLVEDKENKDMKNSVSINTIYPMYKSWFKENFPGSNVQDKSDVLEDLTLRWGRPYVYKGSYHWLNWRYRKPEDGDEYEYQKDKTEGTEDSGDQNGDDLSVYTLETNDLPLPTVKNHEDSEEGTQDLPEPEMD